MSILKNFPFGKKKDANNHIAESKDDLKANVKNNEYDDSELIEGINESIVESLSINHDPLDHDDVQKTRDVDLISESIGGSSTDMSAESIVSTNEDKMMFGATKSDNPGFGSKMKNLFSAKNKVSSQEFGNFSEGPQDKDVFDSSAQDRMSTIVSDIGAQPKPLLLIGKMRPKLQYAFALTLMTASLTAAGYLSITSLLAQSTLKERANIVTRTQLATQNLSLTAQNLALRSDPSAAGTLATERNVLKESSAKIAQDASNQFAVQIVKRIDEEILPVVERALKIGSEIGSIGREVGILERNTLALYRNSDQFTAYLQATASSQILISAAHDMRVRAERLRGNGVKMLSANSVTLAPLAEFGSDMAEMKKAISTFADEGLGLDSTAQKMLEELAENTAAINSVNMFLQKYSNDIFKTRIEVIRMREAVGAVSLTGSSYVKELSSQSDVYAQQIFAALALLGFSVFSLGLLSLVNSRLTKIEAWLTAYKNKSNEHDIIEFMGDITPLEMGDLTSSFTAKTSAMEGITGGIRSSVNEAVTSLRDAMSTVKSTTGSVMNNVSESVESSRDLQNSNDRQSKEIEDVVARVVSLAAAIEDVTNNTTLAAKITSSAKSASDAGALVVGQTNEKMSEIRGNMQDVLKSVKHLGETSHEIGTIVEAIETITDRTQVIAVNASLEAAKAGAAGQGFQVLAGEVNRLAEQSNEALRTITALVQRIQGETAATIRVVELSTNNVVEGAKLSESANIELSKISTLSVQLQEVMATIRTQSQSQSTNAGQVRESMDRLNELSFQFQTTVSQVVAGVQQIDASMGTLKSTVSIFTTDKLSENESFA